MTRRQATLRPLAALILLALPALSSAEMYFPSALVSGDPGMVADLSYLTPAGTQMPGTYEVEMYLNGNWLAARSVRFVAADSVPDTGSVATTDGVKDIRDATGLMACLTPDDWRDLGLKMETVPAMAGLAEDQCISPGRYIAQAYTAFDFENMRLDISIPQAMVKNQPRGWIPPERWDEGINALLLGYRLNGSNSHSRSTGMDSSNLYLNLDNGINIGAWRLRDNRTWSRYSTTGGGSRSQWDRLNTYAERAIIPLRSQLLLGESTTDGDLFDAFSFKGVRLATDDSSSVDLVAKVVQTNATLPTLGALNASGTLVVQYP